MEAEQGPPTTDKPPPTNQHYDLDPAIFELFLDSRMKYSSGLYLSEDDSLETAQRQKLDFICEQLGLRGGARFLDIGCGWGSLSCFAAGKYGCEVTAITPAPRQAEYIRARAAKEGIADRISVHVGVFEATHFAAQRFDAISMVGSIIHMPDKHAVMAECFRICSRRGRVYVSETCFKNDKVRKEFADRPGTTYVREGIFGNGDLLLLSDYVRSFEDAGFSLISLTDLTQHYAKTIDHWRENLTRNQAEIERCMPGGFEKLQRYFDISNAGWGYTSKQYALVGGKVR